MPDWARAAVMLAERRDGLAVFEDVPFPGHVFTLSDLKAELETASGRSLRFEDFPWWALRLTSPVWELAREMVEMRYLWDVPHSLCPVKLDRLLPDFRPSDRHEVVLGCLSSAARARKAADLAPHHVLA